MPLKKKKRCTLLEEQKGKGYECPKSRSHHSHRTAWSLAWYGGKQLLVYMGSYSEFVTAAKVTTYLAEAFSGTFLRAHNFKARRLPQSSIPTPIPAHVPILQMGRPRFGKVGSL